MLLVQLRTLSHILAVATVVLATCMSANLLTFIGVPYVGEGGSRLLKLSPATIACLLAFCTMSLAHYADAKRPCADRSQYALLATYIAAVAFCIGEELLFTGVGHVPVLLENFLVPGLFALALSSMDGTCCTALRIALYACLGCNSVLALSELALHHTVLPLYLDGKTYVPTAEDFRPLALYDHPLTGALLTMMAGFLILNETQRSCLRSVNLALTMLALVAFGGRIATATFLAYLLYRSGLATVRTLIKRRVVLITRKDALAFGLLSVAVLLCFALTPLADRLANHFYFDGSAQVRLDQWQLVRMLHTDQLIFGTAREDVLSAVESMRLLYGVAVVENFLLLMFVSLGFVGFPVFMVGLCCLIAWAARQDHGRLLPLTFAVFIVLTTSNSLGHKSPILLVFVAAVASVPSGGKRVEARASGREFIGNGVRNAA